MNLSEAAELLYLHKNTVAARVKKIKELLGISPIAFFALFAEKGIFLMAQVDSNHRPHDYQSCALFLIQ